MGQVLHGSASMTPVVTMRAAACIAVRRIGRERTCPPDSTPFHYGWTELTDALEFNALEKTPKA
jgi:hypothetical protein